MSETDHSVGDAWIERYPPDNEDVYDTYQVMVRTRHSTIDVGSAYYDWKKAEGLLEAMTHGGSFWDAMVTIIHQGLHSTLPSGSKDLNPKESPCYPEDPSSSS